LIYNYETLAKAAKHSLHNYQEIRNSVICGCYYCQSIFKADVIQPDYDVMPDVGGYTVFCPYCEIDAVIGDYSGFPITNDFLSEMYDYAFSSVRLSDSYKKPTE